MIYISMGSSCLPASALDKIGYRREAFFFDWIWNQHYGLDLINSQIEQNFDLFRDYTKLIRDPKNKNQYIYKSHQLVKFFHHNIMDPVIFKTFMKRLDRFENNIKYVTDEFTWFIYFRCDSNKVMDINEKPINNFCFFVNEVNKFVSIIHKINNDKKFGIIALFRSDCNVKLPDNTDKIHYYNISSNTNTTNTAELEKILKKYK